MSDVSITVSDSTSIDVTVSAATSVDVTTSVAASVDVTEKGPKGDTGATGPQGPAGADGQGLIAGGSENQFIQKNSATDYDTKWSAYTLPDADGDDGQVLTTDGAGAVSFGYPKTISENVKNVSGGTLVKGTPVHVTGSVGNLAEVIAADAATNYPAHFVLDQDLNDEGEGLGIALGFINNVNVPDASIYSEGQTVYLGASGGWTTTKPTGTNAIQNLGIIIKVNTSGNKISGIVMGAGRSNDVPNIPDGQIWIGNASGVATPTAFGVDLDSTPQLGGDLDVNGNKITSASNGDITIDPDGTGAIILKSDDIQFDGDGGFGTGKIKLYESDVLGSNFIAISAPLSVTSDTTFILPDGPPSVSDYALVSSAAGALSWKSFLDGNTETLLGVTSLKPVGALDAMLAFYDDAGDNYIILRAPDVLTGNATFVLPAADGSANQVIKTDGSGNLSFVDQPSGTVDTFATPALGQIAVFTDSNTITGYSSLTYNGSSLEVEGAIDAGSIRVDPSASLSSSGDYSIGSKLLKSFGTNTSSLTVGDVYQYDGGWDPARATTTDGTKMLCVATDAQSRNGMLKEGVVKMADSTGFSSATDGDVLYLDSTAGHVTTTAPTGSSAVVRVVGYVYDASAGTIYFDPSKDWIELTA